jgi:plastocyanin
MRVMRILAVLAIAATFGLAAGCGDDEDDDTATEATTTEEAAAGGGGAIEVGMTEYAFDPADVTVSKGDTITVTNDGQLPHNYTRRGDESGAAELPPDLRDLALGTGDVDPGSSGEFEVGDMALGEYKMICTIPGHAEKGMKGTLTVK